MNRQRRSSPGTGRDGTDGFLIANWNLNQAREIAWTTALALWEARDIPVASDLLRASLGHAVAASSQLLLVAL